MSNNINFEDMLAQVKENLEKVEAEGQTETQLAFTSHKASSDIFYKLIDELEGWSIKACDSRAVPAHYQNTCVLERVNEEAQPTDA